MLNLKSEQSGTLQKLLLTDILLLKHDSLVGSRFLFMLNGSNVIESTNE